MRFTEVAGLEGLHALTQHEPPHAAHGLTIPCGHAVQGRLIDHLRNTQSVGLEDLQALVLDEADRLLQMGFSEEVCPEAYRHS